MPRNNMVIFYDKKVSVFTTSLISGIFIFLMLLSPVSLFSQEKKIIVLKNNISLTHQIKTTAAIYEVCDDIDLMVSNGSLILPDGCELRFNGGKIKNGIIVGKDLLISGDVKLDAVLNGTVKNEFLLYSFFDSIDKLVTSVKNVKCGIIIDKALTINKPLNLEGIKEVVIRDVSNTEASPILLGSGQNMYSLCKYDIDKCGFVKIVGGKNIRCNVGTANTVALCADGKVNGRTAIAYSSFNLMRINNLVISGQNGGWCTENSFFGGTFDNISIIGDYSHNHNVFYNPHLELKGTIIIETGHSNYFRDVRFESTGTIIFGKDTRHNVLSRSYYNDKIGAHFQYMNPNVVNNGDFTNIVYNYLEDYDVRDYQIDRNFFKVNPTSGVTVDKYSFSVGANKHFANVRVPVYRGVGLFVSSICKKGICGKLKLYDDKDRLITEKKYGLVVGNGISFDNGVYSIKSDGVFSFTVYGNRSEKRIVKYAILEIISPVAQSIESVNIKVLGDRSYPNSVGIIYPVD